MDTLLDESIQTREENSAMVPFGGGVWKGGWQGQPVVLTNMHRMVGPKVELERRRREKITEKLPHFGQTVVVKKRSWELQRQGAFESTGEQVKYLTPVAEVSKGHAVLTDRGFVKVESYFIKDIKEPVKDLEDLALVEVAVEEDPVKLRRRIREKASIACLKTQEEEEEERCRVNFFRTLYDEEQHLLGSEAREVPALQKGLAPFRAEQEAEATRPVEDEILQTRIIPNEEVFLNKADWIEAIIKEIKSLEGKKAIRRLTPQEVAYYRREHSDKLEVVPGKAIHSINAPDARKKCRLVVCGNYLNGAGAGGAKQDAAQLYAGGADTTCLRAALAVGAQNDWTAAALDVKTAFLNAPLCTVEESKRKKLLALEDRQEEGHQPMEQDVEEAVDPNRRERLVLMQPPRILLRVGLVQEGKCGWLSEHSMD